MFTHKTKDEVDVALKQYYEAEMKKIADQIALNVQKNEIEHQGRVLKYSQQFLDLQNVAAKQVAEFEHTFHKEKEQKGVELAKLQAAIEFNTQLLAANALLMKEKDLQIAYLQNLVTTYATKALPCICSDTTKVAK